MAVGKKEEKLKRTSQFANLELANCIIEQKIPECRQVDCKRIQSHSGFSASNYLELKAQFLYIVLLLVNRPQVFNLHW